MSLLEKARRLAERDKVIELREASVPVRIIAATIGSTEQHCYNLISSYFKHIHEVDKATQVQRKYERRMQLEASQARLSMIIGHGPDPAKLRAAGFTFREWLAAVEEMRRHTQNLIDLDGLAGHTPVKGQPDVPGAVDADGRTDIAVWQWIKGLEHTQPDVYEFLHNRYLRAAETPDHGGRHPGQQDQGEDDSEESHEPPDPGPDEPGL